MNLSAHLLERVEPSAPVPRHGKYVICWLRQAIRPTENPTIDVALEAARELGVPCFVHFELSENARFASDRQHTFVLEGARDLQSALRERGIGGVFHVHRPGHRQLLLLELARESALVVTDVVPMPASKKWEDAVSREAPLWRVDACCVVPLWKSNELASTLESFVARVNGEWPSRLTRAWVDVEPHHAAFVPEVSSLDLTSEKLADLVAACDIDHGTGPVHHTPGGHRAASERWTRFTQGPLELYSRDRHDPLREGTSRISAYLNHGHLSSFRVVREVRAHQTESADAFLAEILTWREFAWQFSLLHSNPDSVAALPDWATDTLRAHEREVRRFLPSWETLARAQTGHTLWDAAQRSLLVHGELHHRLRIMWAKMLIPWTRNAREALALMLDLNDRSALDGASPSSIVGALWCLGNFDEPQPETRYFGRVRAVSLEEEGKWLDVPEYERRTHRASRAQPLVVGVVGAGVSGASCARALVDAGHSVTVFERSGVGGRLASVGEARATCDAGASYFTVKDERFARFARAWWQERVIAEWKPRFVTLGASVSKGDFDGPTDGKPVVRLVAMPEMCTLVERMLEGLDVRFKVDVDGLVRRDDRFGLTSGSESLGEYDAVVLALPSASAAQLIDPLSFAQASLIREAKTSPVWTLQVVFARALELEFDAAMVKVGPLAWLSRESSKPERSDVERWALRATVEWSGAHLEEPEAQISAALLEAFWATTGAQPQSPQRVSVRLWKEGIVTRPLGVDCVVHESGRVVACGDWCLGSRIESAFLSGMAAAGRLNAIPGKATVEPVPFRPPSQMRLV